jgi:hypothetical protein
MEIVTVTTEQLESIIKKSVREALAERDRLQTDLPEYLTRAQVMKKLNVSREILRAMLKAGWLVDANPNGRSNKIERRSFIETRERVNQIRKETGRKTIGMKDII